MKIKTKKADEILERKKFGQTKSRRRVGQKINIYYFNLYIPITINCRKKVIFIRKRVQAIPSVKWICLLFIFYEHGLFILKDSVSCLGFHIMSSLNYFSNQLQLWSEIVSLLESSSTTITTLCHITQSGTDNLKSKFCDIG